MGTTDTNALRQKIEQSGLKLQHIAKEMGITRFSLSNKLKSETEFKASEIRMMCQILGISQSEMNDIFFTT